MPANNTISWKRLCWEFNIESTVFAHRFIANRQLTRFERVWWAVWLGVSFISCWFLALTTYHKWCENPVVIVYAPQLSPVSTIPFPAITICPLTKTRVEAFNLTEVFEMVKNKSVLDEYRERQLRVMAHVCPFSRYWKNFSVDPNEAVVETLQNMSLSFAKTIALCAWRNKLEICNHLFTETLVDDGFCYTFNELLPNETYRLSEISEDFTSFATSAIPSRWTLDGGYDKQAGLNAFPHRALASGIKSGLIFIPVMRKIDQEFLCRGPYTGYKFAVHTPGEIPLTGDKFYRLNTLNALILMVTPRVVNTGNHLISLSPSRRRCFFNDERQLRFFKRYTESNCLMECISNYTLYKCQCVKFSMPRTARMKVCDASKIDCYHKVYQDMYNTKVSNSMAGNPESRCNCLPACNSLEYDVEISQFPFHFHELAAALEIPTIDYKRVDPAVMIVGFKDRHYLPMWRRELMGITDAVAKMGGFFALLVGASMLSLGELVYYSCIRPLRRERPVAGAPHHAPIYRTTKSSKTDLYLSAPNRLRFFASAS
ncbi:pickpocket protein 28-like [Ochlerotatus camptorhynchus]|uniref:pickpocket protein 28-like n=1 Tax=Ochlerotatus camptorhynchus TaxID=644619 RepID=UPI0031D5BB6B